MKAKLTFNLPEEQEEFNDAINGNAFKAVIWELDKHMRSQIKHGDLADDVQEKVQEIRYYLCELMTDKKVGYE
jgi:hypothetical protein